MQLHLGNSHLLYTCDLAGHREAVSFSIAASEMTTFQSIGNLKETRENAKVNLEKESNTANYIEYQITDKIINWARSDNLRISFPRNLQAHGLMIELS